MNYKELDKYPIEGKTIIFEGVDYSGKTTLIKFLTRESLFGSKNFLSSRGFPSNYIYSSFFNRDINIKRQKEFFEKQLNSNSFLVFFLDHDILEIISRSGRGDDFIKNKNLSKIINLYRKFFSEYSYYSNIIKLPSDNFFNFKTNSKIKFDWNILYNTLKNKKNNILYNYVFDYIFNKEELENELNFLNNFEKIDDLYSKKNNINELKKDKYDFDMMMSQLKFNSHIQLDIFNQKINSRRFVASNITSCLSYIQFSIIEKNKIESTFVFRSSDVGNLLLNDFKSIILFTKEFEKFIRDYHKKIYLNKNLEYSFKIIINNAHLIKYNKK